MSNAAASARSTVLSDDSTPKKRTPALASDRSSAGSFAPDGPPWMRWHQSVDGAWYGGGSFCMLSSPQASGNSTSRTQPPLVSIGGSYATKDRSRVDYVGAARG